MLKKPILVLFVICFVVLSLANNNGYKKTTSKVKKHYVYPESFRDHVYTNLSEKGMETFSAVNIHPLCLKRNGICIPRARCNGENALYISRICYKHDLVCCYDNSIRFPEVGDGSHTTIPNNVKTVATTTREPSTTPLP